MESSIPTATTTTNSSSSPLHDIKSEAGPLGIPSTTTSTVKSESSIHEFDSNEKSVSVKDNKIESDLEQQDKAPVNHTPTGIRRFLLLLGLFLGCILAALDNTIVATALPQISSDFNSQSQMAWIATAYLLAYTAF
ncbi:hypothetical protein BGX33_000993, partial [Mortierella sp. NVP41]